MAFTGIATIKQISDREVRITGLSLASGASGTIGLAPATGGAPDVKLPAAFQPEPYAYGSATVQLQDSLEIVAAVAAIGVATAVPIAVVKTGTTPGDFRGTLTNTSGSLASPNLEIYVKFHE